MNWHSFLVRGRGRRQLDLPISNLVPNGKDVGRIFQETGASFPGPFWYGQGIVQRDSVAKEGQGLILVTGDTLKFLEELSVY